MATRLLVQALILLMAVAVASAQVDDHLTCYRITDPSRLKGLLDLDSSQLGIEAGCRLSTARFFCVPSTKTVRALEVRGQGPVDPLPISGPPAPGDRICYRIRCPARANADQEVTDQFGHRVLRRRGANLVCTPAVKGPTPTSTTTSPSTTTTALRICAVDGVSVDPDGTVDALVAGAQPIPFRVASGGAAGGIFDVSLSDGGTGGSFVCPQPAGCFMGVFLNSGETKDYTFTYTPPASPPAEITLTVTLTPHSPGFTCGPGSSGASGSGEFPTAP